jgi:hypothetical protein
MATTTQTIQSYYQDILQRTGSSTDVSYWTNLVSDGSLTLSQVEYDFVFSPEAQTNVVPVVEAYEVSLGRVPDIAGLTYWVQLADSGTPMSSIEADIANSPEAMALYGTNVTSASLTQLYQNAFDRLPDTGGLNYWLNSGLSMAQIEVDFINSPEGQADLPGIADNYLESIGNGTAVGGSLYSQTTSTGASVGAAPCFMVGTRIVTPLGEVSVERLAADDLVMTSSGMARRIAWVGRRRIDLTRHPQPEHVQPIRIRAGAFADNVPSRDLYVSPDHAILVDAVLVPARLLVNGASLVRDTNREEVVYYHVELDKHDILLAENLETESYLDTGNRGMFENSTTPFVLHPNFENDQARREAESCAPLVTDADRIQPIWRRLAGRAEGLGWRLPEAADTTDEPGLRLVSGSRVITPLWCQGKRFIFALPRGLEAVRLVSRSVVPSAQHPWIEDRRCLGVMVSKLTLRTGDCLETMPLDHPSRRYACVSREAR